jgi:hypothetical protein
VPRKSDSRVAMLADAAVPASTAAVQPPQPQKDRLPDGSEFHARWDATTKRWSGVLDIPLDPANPHLTKRFEAESGALTKLCYKLDDRYRAFLAAVSKAAGESVLPGA